MCGSCGRIGRVLSTVTKTWLFTSVCPRRCVPSPPSVISPEDLIVTKILAGREKDIEDVRSVLRERISSLALALIRATLALLEEALGQSDLRPLFEHELAKEEERPR